MVVKRELVSLLEKNILLFAKLSERINRNLIDFGEYSRQQVQFLVYLHIAGRTRLKDLAAREFLSAPNLCAAFRKMERDGLVLRAVDENDRRNTWYSVTEHGAAVAKQFIEMFRGAIATLFQNINKSDEDELIKSFKSINDILTKMELENA